MKTVVLITGISYSTVGEDRVHLADRDSLGGREIERLLGRGRGYGSGPLPRFLRQIAATEGAVPPIWLVSRPGDPGEEVDRRHLVPAALEELAEEMVEMPSSSARFDWPKIAHRVAAVTGEMPDHVLDGSADLRFLVCGSRTDIEVSLLATFLRRLVGYEHVAVCPHLVGSTTPEGHFAALRYALPEMDVSVLPDLSEAMTFAGLEPDTDDVSTAAACQIEPDEARNQLGDDARRIVELLCMQWTRTRLRPLAGGFSGSLLFLADGWKGSARTEPAVLKIDAFDQMRRELQGYHQVKDFLGKRVPTFGYPVREGGRVGVAMELAAMEGRPETLQDLFERAADESTLGSFLLRLDKTLRVLSEMLYGNTVEVHSVVPYRAFGLHVERQLSWLRQNGDLILGYATEARTEVPAVDLDMVENLVRIVAKNEDALDSETCLAHGDLNYANVICDEIDNVWFIDWTHSDMLPLELDFAKLENDAKFVMSKAFEFEDADRLRRFEEYLVQTRIPAAPDELPDSLRFARWDFRYRKILETIRRVRKVCFGLKSADDWLVYKVALLRYAMHTLSFDKRRDRGECSPVELLYALYSVDALVLQLVSDDYHLRISGDRHETYPARQRISIDEAPWALPCEHYAPPYFVAPAVLESDRLTQPDGWADPEDWTVIAGDLSDRPARRRDADGRPLNPHGRTGLAGRGVLGFWGENRSVAAIIVRVGSGGGIEVALGRESQEGDLEFPKSFRLAEESSEDALLRILRTEVGWTTDEPGSRGVFDGFTKDPRQTDHAWVVTEARLVGPRDLDLPDQFTATDTFEELSWWPLDPETVNSMPAVQARWMRAAIEQLRDESYLDNEEVSRLLQMTG